jgi:hypothetical protein
MDPVTLTLTALAVSAASALQDEAVSRVNDAYVRVKILVARPR